MRESSDRAGKPGARTFARSTSFVPLRVQMARQNFFAKKKNESCGLPYSGFLRFSVMEEIEMCRCSRWLSQIIAVTLVAAPVIGYAQDAATQKLRGGETFVEGEEIIVSATRLPILEEDSPASVSVIDSDDLAQKQTTRVADALREVPGLSVVQTGAPGQLTSVFTRGLRSEHTQVLVDGIPINQGLQGAFNFADLTTDNIDRIEIIRGAQSTLYGPRALAGVIQLFTKQGSGAPSGEVSAEGGSFGTFRETFATSGSWKQLDYSVRLEPARYRQ